MNDPIAAAMVRAGAEDLRGPTQPLTATVSVAEMARRVGVTERTGYKKWDAEDFQIALIREVLSLNSGAGAKTDPDALLDAAREIINDDTIPFRTAMQILFDGVWQSLVDDPVSEAALTLRHYSHGDGRVAVETRASLARVHDRWQTQLVSVIDSFIARYSRHVSVRSDLTTSQMAMAAMILAEGLANQSRLSRELNRDDFDPALPGMLLQALLGYALVFHDSEGLHPLDVHLNRLDEISPSERSATGQVHSTAD